MSQGPLMRILGSMSLVVVAGLVLMVSVWRHVDRSVAEQVTGEVVAEAPVVVKPGDLLPTPTRIRRTERWLPNQPMYLVERLWDRARLQMTVDPVRKAELLLTFAQERMEAAKAAQAAGDYAAAVETANKAGMYLVKMDEVLATIPGQTQETQMLWGALAHTAQATEDGVLELKEGVPEPMRIGLDRVCEMMKVVQDNAPVKVG